VHAHSTPGQSNPEVHDHRLAPPLVETISGRSVTKSFMVGLAHGLAGSAAIALLVTAAIPSPWWASIDMMVFCGGVLVGMVVITAAVGAPFVVAAGRMQGFHQKLSLAAGWLSFAFGFFLAYQIGIVDHLFGTTPTWFPH
jgi:high-affinity nickel-transport protein